MNAFEKIVDMLFAVILIFLLPILYYNGGMNIAKSMLLGQETENFLMRISTAGEITPAVWNELEDSLVRYGCDTFDLKRERRLFEPMGEPGKVAERIYTEYKDGLWKEVMVEGKSRLLKGDKVQVTVYNNGIPTIYFESVRTGATSE